MSTYVYVIIFRISVHNTMKNILFLLLANLYWSVFSLFFVAESIFIFSKIIFAFPTYLFFPYLSLCKHVYRVIHGANTFHNMWISFVLNFYFTLITAYRQVFVWSEQSVKSYHRKRRSLLISHVMRKNNSIISEHFRNEMWQYILFSWTWRWLRDIFKKRVLWMSFWRPV